MNGESGDNVIPFPTRAEPVVARPVPTGPEQTGPVHAGPGHRGPVPAEPVNRHEDRSPQPRPDRPAIRGQEPRIPGQQPVAPGQQPVAPGDPQPLWREVAGGIFRHERIAQGRTLGQVAERAGISPQYLSEVERGRKEPSSEMVDSICGALGLGLADLLFASGRWLRAGGSACFAPSAGGRQHPGMPTGPTMMARLTG